MAARYFIVVGDTTTGGGQAVEGYSGWKVECLDGSSRSVGIGALGPWGQSETRQ